MFNPFGRVRLSRILSSAAVSSKFGLDRGTAIDRYYIERFLKSNSMHIKGEVLEVAENTYTQKFASGPVNSFVLQYDSQNSEQDVKGDLCNLSSLPDSRFDCFICTQTYNFIYDFRSAIKGSFHLLKQGGSLLATVACMSPISNFDADRWGDFWRFTPQSCERVFAEVFEAAKITVTPLGNSASAALFMKGYALEDLPKNFDKDTNDPLFPLIIGIRAVK